MSEGRRPGADTYRVLSGCGTDPYVRGGTLDPTAGAGVASPEGSAYMRYVAGAGELWLKSGAADTAWQQLANGSGTLLNVVDLTELGAVPTGVIDDGAVAYVRDHDDLYTLTKTGGPWTPDGLDIIAGSGGGYWLAQVQGRWDDLMGDPAQGNAASALTNEVFRDTALRLLHFRYDQDDTLHYVYQLPHKWRTDTEVHVHLHVMPLADPPSTKNVYFSGYYTWAPINFSPVPALAGWTTFNATMSVAVGEVYKHKIAEIGQIAAPASPTPSTCLFLYMMREGTNVLDTYDTNKGSGTPAANLALLSSDLHYRAQRMGTLLEYSD